MRVVHIWGVDKGITTLCKQATLVEGVDYISPDHKQYPASCPKCEMIDALLKPTKAEIIH